MKRASILKQEVMQERRIKASFRYRDDIFIVGECGNGNVGTLSRTLEVCGEPEQVSIFDRRLGRIK